MKQLELRTIDLELRADNKTIGGYAAVFYNGQANSEYSLWQDCKERVGKDAFRSLIQGTGDVIASFNHDFVTLLGRRSAGTLSLSVDNIGLRWSVPFDKEDPDHVRISRKIAKGEVTGCSFAFRANEDSWHQEGETKIRTLLDLEVIELGPVILPAYSGTSVGMRSATNDLSEAKNSLEVFETQKILEDITRLDR